MTYADHQRPRIKANEHASPGPRDRQGYKGTRLKGGVRFFAAGALGWFWFFGKKEEAVRWRSKARFPGRVRIQRMSDAVCNIRLPTIMTPGVEVSTDKSGD